MKLTGQRALVTGASGGLGRCFVEQLAMRGADLVITARRGDRLHQLAEQVQQRHGVKVVCLPLDLCQPNAMQSLHDATEGAGLPIDILINNAGFATFGDFLQTPWERTEQMLRVNLLASTEACYRFGQSMAVRGRGHILNVSSFVAYLPVPGYAAYAASKVYVRNFTEALAFELGPRGVRVCALCPGGANTEFWATAGQTEKTFLIRISLLEPDRVARVGVRALLGKRRSIVPGFLARLGCFVADLLPRRLGVFLASRISGRTGGA